MNISKYFIFLFILFSFYSYSMILIDQAVIPISAYSPGAYGTFWKTDVCIFNSMDKTIGVMIQFFSSDGNFYDVEIITVKAKNTHCIKNIVYEMFNYEGYGMLYLISGNVDDEIGVWSRTYTENEDGGSYGQAIDNQLIYLYNRSSYLFGITKNESFRTNIGISCLFSKGSFDVELYDNKGILKKTYKVEVPYDGVVQFPIDIEIENGWAKIIPNGKIPYYGYMSLVDNKTGDAVFMPTSLKTSE